MSSLKIPKLLWFDRKNWILLCFEWTQSKPFFSTSSLSSTVIIYKHLFGKVFNQWNMVSSSGVCFCFYSVVFVIIINDTYKR